LDGRTSHSAPNSPTENDKDKGGNNLNAFGSAFDDEKLKV
jgi:hypothetical protein